jgi:lysine 2,3-aminomutase
MQRTQYKPTIEPADSPQKEFYEMNSNPGIIEARIRGVFSPTIEQWSDWRWHFHNRITTAEQLSKIIMLTSAERREIERVSQTYPFAVTPYYLSLAKRDDLSDPILRQSVPSIEECVFASIGEDDPLNEQGQSPIPGLVHRYPDRALLLVSDLCPVFCRHCSRKRQTKPDKPTHSKADIDLAIEYISRTETLRDIIISGGDPLVLSNSELESILAKIRSIPHVEIIRIGTRCPAVLPQRIDADFCRICDQYGPVWLNTQFNHPNEVTQEATKTVRELIRAGVPVNNQSVLLRGVNDSLEDQLRLCRALLRIRVRPYYLYQADEVRGTEHFRTPVETGLEIIGGLRGLTSGLAIPFFVIDATGGFGKIPIHPNYIVSWTDNELILRNYQGAVFSYRNPHFSGTTRGD